MQLSIIIVNFNTYKLTVDCIQSIQRNLSTVSYEIILVDNAPEKDYYEAFHSVFPQLVYLLSEENIGFGRANNLGIAHAKGRYLLLINSDTLVIDNSLESCFQFMEADTTETIGVLGCKLLNEDLSFQPSFYPFRQNTITNYLLTNNWVLAKLFKINRYFEETGEVLEVGDVSGAFMWIRKKVVDEVRDFDPDFFLYCEETEWCRERIAKRYRIVYYPLAAIIHFGGKSAPREPMYIQSKLSLLLMWYKKGWGHYLLFILFSYLNMLSHLLILPFVQRASRKVIRTDIQSHLKVAPYLFTEVIRYKRAWGSRKYPLIYEGARDIFFGSEKK